MADIIASVSDPDPSSIVLTGNGNTVEVLAGVALGSPASDFSISGKEGSNSVVRVQGSVEGSDQSVINFLGSVGNSVVVGQAGQVLGGTGATVKVSRDARISNAGEIENAQGIAIDFSDVVGGSVKNSGTIFGERGGVEFTGRSGSSAVFENQGSIVAGDGADDPASVEFRNEAVFSIAGTLRVVNGGTITSTGETASGISAWDSNQSSPSSSEIVNSGTIRSAHRWGLDLSHLGGVSTLDNTGTITGMVGAIAGSRGTDVIDNDGDISGRIALGAGNDIYRGVAGRALGVIDGGDGDDEIAGGRNADVLRGGNGNDTLQGNDGTDSFDGGAGSDTVVYTTNTTPVRVDLPAGLVTFPGQKWKPESLALIENAQGGSGGDILIGDGTANRLAGNGGHDVIDAGNGADTVDGGAGNDRIAGGAGPADLRDVIYAGSGHDTVDAGYGNDAVYGMDGNDVLSGGFGADELAGNAGNDTLGGSALSDLLYGNDGSDFLNGGFGYDRVNGGSGADRYYHLGVAGHGSDFIQDYRADDGDLLLFGDPVADADDFKVNFARTPDAGAGAIADAFVIYRPTGQIIWALIDGQAQDEIHLAIGDPSGGIYDLLA